MNLSDYLSKMSDAEAAKRFGITERAARSYRTGWRKPRPQMALKIVRLSKGKLTMDAIYK